MFQSEHLQEKWSPLLDYEGLDPIKDSHRRSVTAVLLENQEKFLKEEQAFSQGINLMEEKIDQHCVSETGPLCFVGLPDRRLVVGATYRFD